MFLEGIKWEHLPERIKPATQAWVHENKGKNKPTDSSWSRKPKWFGRMMSSTDAVNFFFCKKKYMSQRVSLFSDIVLFLSTSFVQCLKKSKKFLIWGIMIATLVNLKYNYSIHFRYRKRWKTHKMKIIRKSRKSYQVPEGKLISLKVSVFRVFLVRIFPHLDQIRNLQSKSSYSVWMREIRSRKTPKTDTFYAV